MFCKLTRLGYVNDSRIEFKGYIYTYYVDIQWRTIEIVLMYDLRTHVLQRPLVKILDQLKNTKLTINLYKCGPHEFPFITVNLRNMKTCAS